MTRHAAGTESIQMWNAVTRGVSAVQHSLSMRAEATGISPPYVPVLLTLLEAEDHRLPMSRIAKDLAMTSGGCTKLADRMARDGLIDRRGSSGDRRVVFAALTDKGLEVGREASDLVLRFLREHVLVTLSAEELHAMADLADRLQAANDPSDAETAFQIAPRGPDAPERRHGEDAD
jgi:DNA-binding MarR family transcriptional regulator